MKDICCYCRHLETNIEAVSPTEGTMSYFCKIYNKQVKWGDRCCGTAFENKH